MIKLSYERINMLGLLSPNDITFVMNLVHHMTGV